MLTFLLIYGCILRKWPGNLFKVFKLVLWVVRSWVLQMLSFFIYLCLQFSYSKQILLLYLRKNPQFIFTKKRKWAKRYENEWFWITGALMWCFSAGYICKQILAGVPSFQNRNCSFIPDLAEIISFLSNLCKLKGLNLLEYLWGLFLLLNPRSTLSGFP